MRPETHSRLAVEAEFGGWQVRTVVLTSDADYAGCSLGLSDSVQRVTCVVT